MTTIKKQKPIIVYALVLVCTGLFGCASKSSAPVAATQNVAATDNVPYHVTEDYVVGVIRYTVQGGDRLSDIALEYTGDSSNWRDIAAFNNISDPRKMRVGSILEIPTDLIPGYEIARSTVPEPQAATVLPPVTSLTVAHSSDPAQLLSKEELAPVVVTPIDTNRNFNLEPLDENAIGTGSYSGAKRQVKVVGSYFPKGIYSEPAAYSTLLMRVTPGAHFSLEQQVNDWYKIDTEKGIGYIRIADAELLD